MRRPYIILFCGCLLTISCRNNPDNTKTSSTTSVNAMPPQSKMDNAGTNKLMTLVTDYYSLKNAFVATNASLADSATTKLQLSTNDMQAYIKNDTVNSHALKPYLDTMATDENELLAIKDDKTCEKKRLPFSKISDQIYAILKTVNLKNAGVYQQHCPMAFDEKGAYWLSNEAEIKNPYYGKKMIECGDVTDSLK